MSLDTTSYAHIRSKESRIIEMAFTTTVEGAETSEKHEEWFLIFGGELS